MKSIAICFLGSLILALSSCGNDHGTEPLPIDTVAPPRPTGLTVTPGPSEAMVQWSHADLDLVEEFRIYYYLEVYDQQQFIAATPDTFFLDSLLVGNLEYCYIVSAVDTNGIEGYRTSAECALVETN
jgi:hypothetical protein